MNEVNWKYINSLVKLFHLNELSEDEVMEILINSNDQINVMEDEYNNLRLYINKRQFYAIDPFSLAQITNEKTVYQYVYKVLKNFKKKYRQLYNNYEL